MVMWSVHTKTFVFHPSLLKLNSKETEAPASKGAYFSSSYFRIYETVIFTRKANKKIKIKIKEKREKGLIISQKSPPPYPTTPRICTTVAKYKN